VFVQQKVMELAGLDAAVVVQVYLEGTKDAVRAATAGEASSGAAKGAAGGAAKGTAKAGAELDAALAAAAAGAAGDAAPAAAAAGAGTAAAKGAKKGKGEARQPPTFDHVIVGISLAEEFPDDRLRWGACHALASCTKRSMPQAASASCAG
jgi:hypothetical protein